MATRTTRGLTPRTSAAGGSPDIVGHAGLAILNPGGAPTPDDLDEALRLGVDRLEVDLCCTADGRLVLRHDVALADGRHLADLDLAEVRAAEPSLITLDQASEHVAGRIPLLLDLKMARAAEVVGVWVRGRADLDGLAVCTENLAWLLHLRFAAPRLARYPSFPDLGERRRHHVQRVASDLWRSHASVRGLRRGAADLGTAARQLRHGPRQSLAHLAGLPWRGRLPDEVAGVVEDVAAAGMCVHHWVVSPPFVEEAHRQSLHVNTWTVNNPFTARVVAAAGVDSITTDRVDLVRRALDGDRRDQPPEPIRAGLRIAPS